MAQHMSNGNSIPLSRSRFTFKHSWFELIRDEWTQLTAELRERPLRILEVGCFEGASTTWILDNLMDHPDSRLTAIDHFAGGMDHHDQPTEDYDSFSDIEDRFRANVALCPNVAKLRIVKANSDDGLMMLRQENAWFDFIYIDASHVALDVLHDAVLCWRMLAQGGTLVFDDFSWKGYNEDCYNPRLAIIAFLKAAAPELRYKTTESQVWITRVPNYIPATRNPDPDLMYAPEVLAKALDI